MKGFRVKTVFLFLMVKGEAFEAKRPLQTRGTVQADRTQHHRSGSGPLLAQGRPQGHQEVSTDH